MRLIFQALCLLLPGLAAASTPQQLEALDAAFARRGQPAEVQALDRSLTEALKAEPRDFELLWRASRLKQWIADGATDERLKKQAGKEAWELGDRARALNPARVEGHLYAAIGLGAYSQAVGVVKALRQGLEREFLSRLDAATRANADYLRGNPVLVRGRYHYELPWPKRDLDKSAAAFRQVLKKHPEDLRAWLYLAETLLKDGKEEEARAAILKVTRGSAAYDPAEATRVQRWGREVQAKIEEELR